MKCLRCGYESDTRFCPKCGQLISIDAAYVESPQIDTQPIKATTIEDSMTDLYIAAPKMKVNRGTNTMGFFAILASLATFGFDSSGYLALVFLAAFVLIIWAFAEAVAHYLRFYPVVISLLIFGLGIYRLVALK
ncbi:MAG TPA: zinc ribbon domain-containing protein [Clostridia bacterium]|nr:zinc ribbon domain-containing protein [Clostridia bacterium]